MLQWLTPFLLFIFAAFLMTYYAQISALLVFCFVFLVFVTMTWCYLLTKEDRKYIPQFSLLQVLFSVIYFLLVAISIGLNRVGPNYFISYVLMVLLCIVMLVILVLWYPYLDIYTPVLGISFVVCAVWFVVGELRPV